LKTTASALLVVAILLSTALPFSVAQGLPETAALTVYPDGSIVPSFNLSSTAPATPQTELSENAQTHAVTSAGITTVLSNGSVSLPPYYANQAPYNSTRLISVDGFYSNGVSKGAISVQALPGVYSPLTSFKLNYQGNKSSLTISGNTTVQYGTYSVSSSQLPLNASTIGAYVTLIQREGFNATYLSKELALLPYANLTMSELTLSPKYENTSATISIRIVMNGNITAIPPALATDDICSALTPSHISAAPSDGSLAASGSNRTANSPCADYYSLFGVLSSATLNSTYDMTYSSGVVAFDQKTYAKENLNLDQAMSILGRTVSVQPTWATPSQAEFINSTRIDVSGFSERVIAGYQSGNESVLVSIKGPTIYPRIVPVGNTFNESGFFNFLGPTKLNVTLVGGANSAGSVSIEIPKSVPAPASTTPNSATWTEVNASALAGVLFTVSPSTTTTSSSSYTAPLTAAASNTTSTSAPPSGPPSSTLTYVGLGGVAVVVIAVAAILLRRVKASP
jgi:hypothetical protein